MLNDNFLLSLTVQETASAKRYSADSETEYSVSTPLDKTIKKVVTEVKSLQNASTDLSKRVEDATKSMNMAKDGHAVAVDLEYNEKTGKYYIGDGAPNTFIASLNPATATESEPMQDNGYAVVYELDGSNGKHKAGFTGYAGGVKTAPTGGKTYKNGSTVETVYADTAKKTKIGSLDEYEECTCLGKIDGMYLVFYKVNGTSNYKLGFVAYSGGCEN